MEHIPLHKSVQWLESNKSTVDLLKSFYSARVELELNIEALLKAFACKWQRKFMDLEKDPLLRSQGGKKSLADIMRLLAKEPEDGAVVCCSVKSSLLHRHSSPTALLKNWISTYDEDSIDEYRITYMDAVDTMAESEKNVIRAKRILIEEEDVKLVYSEAVDKYTEEKAMFQETMVELQKFLERNAKCKMDFIKKSLQRYITVISECDKQRMSRKQRLVEAEQQLAQFSVERTVEHWLADLQEPIMFPDYESAIETPPQKLQQATNYAVRKPELPAILITFVEETEERALRMEEKARVYLEKEEASVEEEMAETEGDEDPVELEEEEDP